MKSKQSLRFAILPANLKVIVSLITMVMLVLSQFFSHSVYAQEYTVSGNGKGSSNSVNVVQTDSLTVEQDNQAEIVNEVSAQANTGNNEASGNTGEETSIETGDVQESVSVLNSGNSNTVVGDCCPSEEESSIEILGNGADSANLVNHNQNTNTLAVQENALKLTNNIYIHANTGDNEASDNSGEVMIITGEVNIQAAVKNHNLNSSFISLAKPKPLFGIKVSGNGAGSTNNVDNNLYSDDQYFVNNYLELNNNINVYANTGGNKANKNNSKVLISTGNVYLDIILSNKHSFSPNKVNTSIIIADCGCKSNTPSPTPTPSPSGSPVPSSPPSGGDGGGGSSGDSGGSGGSGGSSSPGGGGGQVLGATLPATGGFSIFQATIFALLMMVSGVILRLDYGKIKKQMAKVKSQAQVSLFYDLAQSVGKLVNWKLPVPVPRDLFANFACLLAR